MRGHKKTAPLVAQKDGARETGSAMRADTTSWGKHITKDGNAQGG